MKTRPTSPTSCIHAYIHDGCLLVKRAWPSLTLYRYRRSWDRQWLLKPASDLHTLPQTQQTKSFGCAFPLCSPEPGAWCILRYLARPDRLLHTFPHSLHANWLMPRNASWLARGLSAWLRRWLARPALDKHTRPHSLHTNCERSGSILSPFLAALFVLAQIFALSWKQRDPLYTIFLHLFLSHATISQSGSSNFAQC